MEVSNLLILLLISAVTAAPTLPLDRHNPNSATTDILGDIFPEEADVCNDIINRNAVPLESCKAIQESGFNKSGLYRIQPDGAIGEFTVYCDMTLLGGGWTVFQRRIDDSVNFNRKFSSYRNGFGSFCKNFWLGLEKIHRLTHNVNNMELYVGLENFNGETAFARYSDFAIENEDAGYTLRIGEFDKSSTAGDSLQTHDGQRFSTHDKDRDALRFYNCAENTKGGWWYKNCHDANLNGVWYQNGRLSNPTIPDGIIWQHWTGNTHSLKTVVLAMRPSN